MAFKPIGGCGCCDSPWIMGETSAEAEAQANARLIAAAPDLLAERDRLRAEVERLRAGIICYLEDRHERPVAKRWRVDGKPSPHDQCPHGFTMREVCGVCIDAHFERLLVGKEDGE